MFHTELAATGPGLLYRDILRPTPQVQSVVRRIVQAQPDLLFLLDVDYDAQLLAARALARLIVAQGGPDYPHMFARPPNSGISTGLDLDGDGRLGEPEDAQGFGAFAGQGGMVLLSRPPINKAEAQDFSTVLWQELPWATLPGGESTLFPSARVMQIQRLSTTGHWAVPVLLPSGQSLTLLAFHATPPAFDGPEDRNGLRNADEIRFWQHFLTNAPPDGPVVLLGGANLDPLTGDGHRDAIQSLLSLPFLQDPFAALAPRDRTTVDWSDLGLGLLRTDYLLPSRTLRILNSGIGWPDPADKTASRHALVWVDIDTDYFNSDLTLETSPPN